MGSALRSGEVSRLLGVTIRTVHNWVRERGLPCYETPGKHKRFKRHELARWLRDVDMPVPAELELV